MRALFLAFALLATSAAAAHADPCEAIQENVPLPSYLSFGSTFSGPVDVVIDGDSLCLAVAPGSSGLVEVRISDFWAPEFTSPGGPAAKAALERIALGKQASCVANLRTYDRIAARCTIGGTLIGDLMRSAGVREGGNGLDSGAPRVVRFASPSSRTAAVTSGGGFRSCAAARAAGAAPLYRGRPGYRPQLDADGDGIACEPYR
jgi:micrococcal nuclease